MNLHDYIATLNLNPIERDMIIKLSKEKIELTKQQKAIIAFARDCTWDKESMKFYIDGVERKPYLKYDNYFYLSYTYNVNEKSPFKISQLVAYLTFGRFPNKNECIDHKDNNTQNDHPLNIRIVTKGGNAHNSKKSKNNTSGIKGVSKIKCKTHIYWHGQVQITLNDKIYKESKIFPYTDEGKLLAEKFVKETRIKLHGECANHG